MREAFDLKHRLLAVIVFACAYASFGSSGFTTRGTIDSLTSAGTILQNGVIYTVTNSPTIRGGAGQNALVVDADSTVALYIPEGETLTVEGGSVVSGGVDRARAAILLPSNSVLVVCGEGNLVATGGAAADAGLAAPYGIGSGGAAATSVAAGSGTGSAAGIGGDGETSSDTGSDRSAMGTLYLFGRLTVTAMPGAGGAPPEAAAGNGRFITSVADSATPTLDIGGDRQPDTHANTHEAVCYDAFVRDSEGGVSATNRVTLGMPYPARIEPPRRLRDMSFDGYTNSVGDLVYDTCGLSTGIPCRTIGDHDLYAVWTPLGPYEKYGTIDASTPAGTILRDGATYTVTNSPTIRGGVGQNALVVDEDSTVALYIPEGETLTVEGDSVASGGDGRARAGIYLPSGSVLIVCGEGALVATGGSAADAGLAAPYGIGSGGAAATSVAAGSGSGSAAGIGGDGETGSTVGSYHPEMGTLYLFGRLTVTAMPGAGGSPPEAAATDGLFITSVEEAATPTLDIGGDRRPDSHANTHPAVCYNAFLRDSEGGVVETNRVTLAMPYPGMATPPLSDDCIFIGYEDPLDRLVIGPLGKPTTNLCRQACDHEIRAVWSDGVNTTEDQSPEEISYEDDIVSLREAIGLLCYIVSGQSGSSPVTVPISPVLKEGMTDELVFHVGDNPLDVTSRAGTPILLDGLAAGLRPMVVEGGSGRKKPLFRAATGCGLRLQNLTVRNTSGSVDGVAVLTTTGAELVVENVLFEAIDTDVGCGVRASGTSRVLRTTFRNCAGVPLSIGEGGTPGILAESTVVPLPDGAARPTGKVVAGAAGAVLSCTIPSGVEGPGPVVGSYTGAITSELFKPAEALSETVDKVRQYYYTPHLMSGFSDKGEGCFVCHDETWTNVAWNVMRTEVRHPIFGNPSLATETYDHDVRNVQITFPWNTRGSYATSVRLDRVAANTTADQSPDEISFEDDVVSLREAVLLAGLLAPVQVESLAYRVQIAPSLIEEGTGPLVFTLLDTPLVQGTDAGAPVTLDGDTAGSRPLVIDGGGVRTTNMVSVSSGCGLRLKDVLLRNASGSPGNGGLAVVVDSGGWFFAENCRFADIRPTASDVSCVRALGSGGILYTTWADCPGCPFDIGAGGGCFTLAESTVVPCGTATRPGEVRSGGAVMSCTIPSGVNATDAGAVLGSFTAPITAERFHPTTAMTVTVERVDRCYYRPNLTGGLAKKGEGCFVWHDAAWTNVACSVTADETTKTGVFGSVASASNRIERDIRNVKIVFPWNTRGSTAVCVRESSYAVTTADDEDPTTITTEDDVVTLREEIELLSILSPEPAYGQPDAITFTDELTAGSGDLVFGLSDVAVPVSAVPEHPLVLDGAAAGSRPLVLDGGGILRTEPIFAVSSNGAFRLRNATVRNASGATGKKGLAIAGEALSRTVVENCLFSNLAPETDGVCVRTAGSGAILRSSWYDCSGRPLVTDGGRFALVESTVVPKAGTREISLGAGGAVLASTVPCGVEAASGAVVAGSHTEAITSAKFCLAEPLSVTVDKVTQHYYRPNLTGGLARKGEGCFVWHDADWANVARSVTADETTKTEVFGSVASATNRVDRDIRNVTIDFPWNTRGSCAVCVRESSYAVTTKDDQDPTTITTEDDVVTLREAIELLSILSPDPAYGQPDAITFTDALTAGSGDLVFGLSDVAVPVSAVPEHPLVLDGAAAGSRPLVLDGGGIVRTEPIFAVSSNGAFRLRNATVRNASGASGTKGLAIAAGVDSRTVVENCLLSNLAPATDAACVRTAGSGVILQSSWKDCSGRPLVTDGGRFALVESTVVPKTGTREISLGAGGAVLASTVPCGVASASGAVVAGSITSAITSGMCSPTTPLAVTVGKVTQYYYRVGLCSGLAKKGAGCFVWHDEVWANVARSVTADAATKTDVFGSVASATNRVDRDVRNVEIAFPWNTCGSYAVAVNTASGMVTTADDQKPEEIVADDAKVSLRESIELLGILSPEGSTESRSVTFSPNLVATGKGDLVFKLMNYPIVISSARSAPLIVSGDAVSGRMVVIDGNGSRAQEVFSVTNGCGFCLKSVALRNAAGADGRKGLAIVADEGSFLTVSNCLFSSLSPATGVPCVHAAGSGSIGQASWSECSGSPANIGGAGGTFTLFESTVVPTGDTLPVTVNAGGAVISCTFPANRLTVNAGGQSIANYTNSITSADFDPTDALSTNLSKVTQHYYKVRTGSTLMLEGEGRFVWHDPTWANVAVSVQRTDMKTAVFGSTNAVTTVFDRDVRGHSIVYLWNTRGSYAVTCSHYPTDVNTTADPPESTFDYEDDVVSLREALYNLTLMPGLVSRKDQIPNQVTFADSIFEKGVTTLRLDHGALEVGDFSESKPLRVTAPADGRVVKIDLESDGRAFDITNGTHVVLSGLDFVNGRADSGGAIRTRSPLTVERCRFSANTGTLYGGAIYADDQAGLLTLRDSVFEANGKIGGNGGGGAVGIGGVKLTAEGCTFAGNVTKDCDGGAIYANSGDSVATISNCVFSGNAGFNTGAVCARGTLTVVSSKFAGNASTSPDYGGGAIWSDHNATIRLCDFAGNVSAGGGGALRVERSGDTTVVRSCLFEDNVSVKSGGALSCYGELTLDGSTFRANRVTDAAGFGGAVSIGSKAASIVRCRFEANVSAFGGGALRVGTSGDSVLVTDSTFFGNVAEGSDGGAISFDGASSRRRFTLVNCSFFENVAANRGGAIYAASTDCLLANVTITGNRAKSSGGGLHAADSTSAFALVNVLASGNPGPTVTSSTADVCGCAPGWKICNAMIRKAGSLDKDTTKWIIINNSASEGNIFASVDGKYSEVANGASQLARRLKSTDTDPNPSCGAVVRHSGDWKYVTCQCYGIKRGTRDREALGKEVVLRSGDDTLSELRTDITGRSFAEDVTPCMGSLWNVPDSVSGVVSTLADVSDEKDGAVSLREILANLKTEETWRDALYDATRGGYRLTFKEGLAGTLNLNGCALVVEGLDGVPVFLEGPTDRPITIDGQSRFRGLNVCPGERLEISNLTFTNCCTPKGAIDYDGGGIRNAGSLVATDVAFYACTAGQTSSAPEGCGGAVSTLTGATSRLERCSFVGNVAAHGGAVAVRDGGRLTVAGATFEGNSVVMSGSYTEARGSAAYVEGATTDALFAHCTFANNTGANHAATQGGAAVYAENRGASSAKTVLVNCVAVGNGGADLATTGRMRLVGTTYGVRIALDGAADETATWFHNTTEAATCTNGLATADVYAHTLTNGMPLASVRRVGPVNHTVVPLAVRETPLGSVFLRAQADWSLVAWSATASKNDAMNLLRGASSVSIRSAPLVTTDQLGESTGGTATWPGALIRQEAKDEEDPPPVGPEPGAITEPTYEALLDAIATARARSPENVVVFVTAATSNETISVPRTIAFPDSGRVTIRGPLTLDADGSGRIFSVAGGVTLRLEEITLTRGDATVNVSDEDAGAGGAVYLDSADKSKMAKLEAEKCSFTGNRAYYGGAVAAFGLGCAESFADCTFPPESNVAAYDPEWEYGGEGAAIYHNDQNLTIAGGTIDLNEIYPKPAYAVTTPSGATALFGSADVPDPGESSVGPDDLSMPFEDAREYAAAAGAGAKVVPLSTAAVAAKAAAAGVPAAAVEEEMTPEVTEITLSTAAGTADGEVSIAPQNLVPFMTYSIEYAASPEALGTPAAQSGNKVRADASGHLASPLTAPATGDSGFYRVVAE